MLLTAAAAAGARAPLAGLPPTCGRPAAEPHAGRRGPRAIGGVLRRAPHGPVLRAMPAKLAAKTPRPDLPRARRRAPAHLALDRLWAAAVRGARGGARDCAPFPSLSTAIVAWRKGPSSPRRDTTWTPFPFPVDAAPVV